jgi:carbonic anhydrase
METPRPSTPEAVLSALLEGNRRWTEDRPTRVHRSADLREPLADGQKPIATVFTCIDSRVAPEIVFDCGIGELVVIRTGAHVLDEGVVLGSLEFAVNILRTPLLLVMGHESCGAVRGALEAITQERSAPGAIQTVVEALRPAYEATAGEPEPIDEMVREHARLTAQRLAAHPSIAPGIAEGRLAVRGARYALGSGVVELLD